MSQQWLTSQSGDNQMFLVKQWTTYYEIPWMVTVRLQLLGKHMGLSINGTPKWMVHSGQSHNKIHRIGLWENLQESPINLMVKTMVSCRFSLKPVQWKMDDFGVPPFRKLPYENHDHLRPGSGQGRAELDWPLWVPGLRAVERWDHSLIYVNQTFTYTYKHIHRIHSYTVIHLYTSTEYIHIYV